MKPRDFLNLKNISGQIAALVIASIIAIHLIMAAIFLVGRPDQPDPTVDRRHAQFTAAVQLLGAAPANDRPRLIADIARAFPQLAVESLPPGPVPPAGDPEGLDLRSLHRRLDSSYRIFPLAHDQDGHNIGIALPDGTMISARILPDQRRVFWGGPWVVTLLFAIVSVTLLGLWAARALTAPLSSFAKAAESFSLNGAAAPLPERGPEEIRSVAKALKARKSVTKYEPNIKPLKMKHDIGVQPDEKRRHTFLLQMRNTPEWSALIQTVHWFHSCDAIMVTALACALSKELKTVTAAGWDDDFSGSSLIICENGKQKESISEEGGDEEDGWAGSYEFFYEHGIYLPQCFIEVNKGASNLYVADPKQVERADRVELKVPKPVESQAPHVFEKLGMMAEAIAGNFDDEETFMKHMHSGVWQQAQAVLKAGF